MFDDFDKFAFFDIVAKLSLPMALIKSKLSRQNYLDRLLDFLYVFDCVLDVVGCLLFLDLCFQMFKEFHFRAELVPKENWSKLFVLLGLLVDHTFKFDKGVELHRAVLDV